MLKVHDVLIANVAHDAQVAQLVEHPICNRAVGSSSLSASTTFKDPRSEFRGSSDCFQTINVLEQEFELLWCG